MDKNKPLWTISDVAKYFNVSQASIRRWWSEGRLPAPVKVHRTIRWRPSDIEKCLSEATPSEIQVRLPAE